MQYFTRRGQAIHSRGREESRPGLHIFSQGGPHMPPSHTHPPETRPKKIQQTCQLRSPISHPHSIGCSHDYKLFHSYPCGLWLSLSWDPMSKIRKWTIEEKGACWMVCERMLVLFTKYRIGFLRFVATWTIGAVGGIRLCFSFVAGVRLEFWR